MKKQLLLLAIAAMSAFANSAQAYQDPCAGLTGMELITCSVTHTNTKDPNGENPAMGTPRLYPPSNINSFTNIQALINIQNEYTCEAMAECHDPIYWACYQDQNCPKDHHFQIRGAQMQVCQEVAAAICSANRAL